MEFVCVLRGNSASPRETPAALPRVWGTARVVEYNARREHSANGEDIAMTRNAWTRHVLRLATGLLLLATWAAARADDPVKLLTEQRSLGSPARHARRPPPGVAELGAGDGRSLPRTTAAMLDLDRLHRTRSPLGPVLRGKMRWVAADANRCEYSRATAEADLRRAGVADAEIAALKAGPIAGPPSGAAAPWSSPGR